MSIRSKLFLIVFLMILGSIVVLGVNLVAGSAKTRIGDELAQLDNLESALVNLRLNISLLNSEAFETQHNLFLKSRKDLDESFSKLDGLKMIPAINEETKSAFDSIINLKTLLIGELETLDARITEIYADAKDVFINTLTFTLNDFFINSTAVDHEKHDVHLYHLSLIRDSFFSLNLNFDMSLQLIRNQKTLIEREINAMNARNMYVTLANILVILAGILFFVFRTAGKIVKTVRGIDNHIAAMKNGDLTVEYSVKSRDELGRLSANLNDFTRSLRESIDIIKRSSKNNLDVEAEMTAGTTETSSSITEIDAGAVFIKKRIEYLDTRIKTMSDVMDSVTEFVAALDTRLQEQSSMIEESTASVTEMIASVRSVADITSRKQDATRRLVDTARDGGEKLELTNTIIAGINNSIDDISSTAEVIQGVAGQTNLLAMNAAIEAAHAGEAGKGFAVVAEEIRKLAEASAESSTHISGILKEIVTRIEEATRAGIETGDAFNRINTEIKDVVESFTEIASSMGELSSGGQQVLTAMNGLQNLSVEVRNDDRNMAEAAGTAREAMTAAAQISAEVLGSISEISHGINEVSTAVNGIHTLSGKVNTIARNLNEAVSGFTTEQPESI